VKPYHGEICPAKMAMSVLSAIDEEILYLWTEIIEAAGAGIN